MIIKALKISAFIILVSLISVSSAKGMGSRPPEEETPLKIETIKDDTQRVIESFEFEEKNKIGTKASFYAKTPSAAEIFWTDKEKYSGNQSIRIEFNKRKEGWCGFYVLLKEETQYFNASEYKYLAFMVKGERGGETFEIGIADKIWDEKGDSVKAGAVEDFLEGKIKKYWQQVILPLDYLERIDTKRLASIAINFYAEGAGKIYIDDIVLGKKSPILPGPIEVKENVLLVDDFEIKEKNKLKNMSNFYVKEPSEIKIEWTEKGAYGEKGKSLKIDYDKKEFGWCGIYTLLKKGQRYLDATTLKELSFMVKGEKGGEKFDINMADKKWDKIGGSVRGGSISDFLPGGVTTEWQEVKITLEKAFWELFFYELAAISINLKDEGTGTIYIDNITLRK